MTTDLWHLTRRLKSLQHDTLQPENGLANGICWHSNIVEQRMLSLHAYMAGGGTMVTMFLRKANFSLQQRNIFYLTIKVVETTLRMVPPSQSQLKVIINPTN